MSSRMADAAESRGPVTSLTIGLFGTSNVGHVNVLTGSTNPLLVPPAKWANQEPT